MVFLKDMTLAFALGSVSSGPRWSRDGGAYRRLKFVALDDCKILVGIHKSKVILEDRNFDASPGCGRTTNLGDHAWNKLVGELALYDLREGTYSRAGGRAI